MAGQQVLMDTTFCSWEDVINGWPDTRELPYLLSRVQHSDHSEYAIVEMLKRETFFYSPCID